MSIEDYSALNRIRAHNRRLRVVLASAAAYGALATMVALWGWLR